MFQPTLLDLPAEVCRVILNIGTVVFDEDKLVAFDRQVWVEIEPLQ